MPIILPESNAGSEKQTRQKATLQQSVVQAYQSACDVVREPLPSPVVKGAPEKLAHL